MRLRLAVGDRVELHCRRLRQRGTRLASRHGTIDRVIDSGARVVLDEPAAVDRWIAGWRPASGIWVRPDEILRVTRRRR